MLVSSQTVNTPTTGVWQALLPPFPPTTPGHKGRFVLGPAAHQLGQKSRPLLVAMPACTHVTVTVAPNRRANPSAYAINADNASPVTVPAGVGQSTTASGASRTSNPVNRSLIEAAEARNPRNQPRTVEIGAPAPRRDPPVPPSECGLRLDRRRDHVGAIGPPDRQPHLEQHMGCPAATTPRSTRLELPTCPIRAEALPNDTRPSRPPGTQPAPATGAGHTPGQQVQLDRNSIITYREHQRGLYALERPGVIRKDRTPGRSSIRTSSA